MRPMLASSGTAIPRGRRWAHEIKWDGMRVLADVADGRLKLLSRNGKDVTSNFPELSTLAGPGVPDDLRAAVFEPFRQAPGSAAEHSPGVGVGLSLVLRFAELHGGRAWLEERPGGGASFRVFLPDGRPQD